MDNKLAPWKKNGFNFFETLNLDNISIIFGLK